MKQKEIAQIPTLAELGVAKCEHPNAGRLPGMPARCLHCHAVKCADGWSPSNFQVPRYWHMIHQEFVFLPIGRFPDVVLGLDLWKMASEQINSEKHK